MLGFVEEIVLLQLDERGKLVELPMSAADVVLAGAALMELALRNKVDTDINRFLLSTGSRPGTRFLTTPWARSRRPEAMPPQALRSSGSH